jgi:hypothetical protein
MRAPGLLTAALRRWEGKELDVRIEPHKDGRSQKQNRWYWGQVLGLVSEHTGYTPEELHEYFKSRFIPKRIALSDDNGVVVDDRVIGGSSAKLDVEAFAHYCECIRQFAAEDLGVVIPDPDGGY